MGASYFNAPPDMASLLEVLQVLYALLSFAVLRLPLTAALLHRRTRTSQYPQAQRLHAPLVLFLVT